MCEKLLPSSSLICDSETFMTFSLVLRGLHTCHCIKLNEFDFFFEKNLSGATFFLSRTDFNGNNKFLKLPQFIKSCSLMTLAHKKGI